jgi:hypothetical protein
MPTRYLVDITRLFLTLLLALDDPEARDGVGLLSGSMAVTLLGHLTPSSVVALGVRSGCGRVLIGELALVGKLLAAHKLLSKVAPIHGSAVRIYSLGQDGRIKWHLQKSSPK